MARRSAEGPDGLCIVDKAPAMTSHDVVARARRELGTRRVGHAGTLDPMATGVLVLGVGRATRLLTFITGVDKTYEATIRFGIETDSLDADGDVTATHDMEPPTPDEVEVAAAELTGPILQVPPMVSAVKVGGRRLHELAREGVEVERAPRPVTVHRFELTPTEDPLTWRAVITCSSGTYVRVLAADLGRALGGGAHLSALRRTEVGPFHLDEASTLDSLELLEPLQAVRHLPQASVDEDTALRVQHGAVLEESRFDPVRTPEGATQLEGDPWAVIGPEGDLLAVYVAHKGRRKPAVVLAPAAG